jgi:hypothetical protein
LKRKWNETDDHEDGGVKKSKWIEYESEIENSDDDDSEETVDENEGYIYIRLYS